MKQYHFLEEQDARCCGPCSGKQLPDRSLALSKPLQGTDMKWITQMMEMSWVVKRNVRDSALQG